MGIQITYHPAPSVKIDHQRSATQTVIDARTKGGMFERELERAGHDVGVWSALPNQPVDPSVVPAKGQRLESIELPVHQWLLRVDVPRFGISPIDIPVIGIHLPMNIAAMPQVVEVRYGFPGCHLYLVITDFAAEQALETLWK